MKSVVMIGATGAVGGEAVSALCGHADLQRLTTLGRRAVGNDDGRVTEEVVDLSDVVSYRRMLDGHDVAICTLGVGEPSKVAKAELKRIDYDLVLTFAKACASAGVRHFQLLSSVGVSASSSSFYLRTKGELEQSLRTLSFERLSFFHPSMILTPTNRYGISQAVTLRVWPWLNPVLQFGLRPFRGVRVEDLGRSIAMNTFTQSDEAVETLEWDDFQRLSSTV
jgi:uncharacterized protein YbjT (DUF2867 family)